QRQHGEPRIQQPHAAPGERPPDDHEDRGGIERRCGQDAEHRHEQCAEAERRDAVIAQPLTVAALRSRRPGPGEGREHQGDSGPGRGEVELPHQQVRDVSLRGEERPGRHATHEHDAGKPGAGSEGPSRQERQHDDTDREHGPQCHRPPDRRIELGGQSDHDREHRHDDGQQQTGEQRPAVLRLPAAEIDAPQSDRDHRERDRGQDRHAEERPAPIE
ncbi:unnamed protein product, partial [Penicillium discolor]